ncbi:unnamed protein product [Camellia sinensis]
MLDVFKIIRVVQFRIAGNANNSKFIGDVTIPKQYFNCGLWDWLKPNGTLGTSDKGHLEFGNYNLPKGEAKGEGEVNNELGRMGYSTEQFFSESGKPNNPQSLLWAEINSNLLKFASNLEESPNAKSISLYCVVWCGFYLQLIRQKQLEQGMELEQCLNSSECLPKKPKLVLGLKGSTPNTFMTSLSNGFPVIVIRGLSDLAWATDQNLIVVFGPLAALNVAKAEIQFVKILPGYASQM